MSHTAHGPPGDGADTAPGDGADTALGDGTEAAPGDGVEAPARESALASEQALRASARVEDRLAKGGGWIELLRVPALMFEGVVRARRAAYDHRWMPIARLDVPVVGVGNLSSGGTGKTPACAWLVRELGRRGWRPGVLARGFGATHARAAGESADVPPALNDEGRVLAALFPDLLQAQDADRVRGGRALVERGAEVIVLDDGFQHRRLFRDLDLVLIDATRPWGFPHADDGRAAGAWLLPRGLLREPPSSLARADAIVLSRADQLDERALVRLESEIAAVAPGRPLCRARHAASGLRDARGCAHPLSMLAGARVELVSGIGNPAAFERSVRSLGARVESHRAFPDHHAYVASDVADLARGGQLLVTTSKDAVKLAPLGAEFLALEIEFELATGGAVIEALLDSLEPGQRSRERAAIHGGLHG